jgi:hypothetical protein
VSDGERLPSSITGAQPQSNAQNLATNGNDNGGEERFPRRRRRHRSTGPRPDMAGTAPSFRGEDGGDSAGNS